MKKILITVFLLSSFLFVSNSYSQAWLPQPVNSPYFNALEGTWVSEPYEFMGNSGQVDVITCTKILNGQYMEVDVKSSNNNFSYEAKEIITPKSDGSLSGTFYDIFAKGPNPTTYTLSEDGGKLLMTISGGTGSRNVVIDGNTMTQDVTFRMGESSSLPEQKIFITYKKQ